MATVYIAGGMQGFPGFRFDEFDRVAARFRKDGHRVYNPAEHDRESFGLNPDDFPTGDFSDQHWTREQVDVFMRGALAWDTEMITRSQWIVVLPDSENSKGTAVELALAKLLGLRIIHLGRNE